MGHGLGCGDISCIDWLVSAAVVRVFCALLPSGRFVYGARVAAAVPIWRVRVSHGLFIFFFWSGFDLTKNESE